MESQIDQETKKKLIEVDSNVRKNKDGAINEKKTKYILIQKWTFYIK
jgi:hypothetical protein